MSAFESNYYSFNIEIGVNTFTTTESAQKTYVTREVVADLGVGSRVCISDASGLEVFTASYIGRTQSGWIGACVVDGQATYLYFSTTPIPVDTAISFSTDDVTTGFLAGTRIACPCGERRVEEIAVGDLVLTASGVARPVWKVVRQVIVPPLGTSLECDPVRIRAGALGNGVPARALRVSQSHGLMFEGVLVQAGVLVNGTTIAWEKPAADRIPFHHLELAAPDLVLAEGVAAESLVAHNGARARFGNGSVHAVSGGAWEEPYDPPRVICLRQFPHRLRRKLAEITAALEASGEAAAG